VHTEHPRAGRYPFLVGTPLTCLQSQAQITARTPDLSFPTGTRVGIRMAQEKGERCRSGDSGYAGPNAAMGVPFTRTEQKDQLVLD